MDISIGKEQFILLITKQVENLFGINNLEKSLLIKVLDEAFVKASVCFEGINNKYYFENGQTYFNPFHSGQYAIFLYYLSNIIWKNENSNLADKIYYLNKTLNSLDLFYEIELPEVFFVEHPVGSVMGRAIYGNYFVFQQNCTVGGNHGIYPSLGEYVWMFANASILGNSIIGNNVFVSAGALIKDENIPDNSIVFGTSPNLIVKNKDENYFLDKSLFNKHLNNTIIHNKGKNV